MIREDDRTDAQRHTHRFLAIGTDKGMSGWGEARGGASVAAWACQSSDWDKVLAWVGSRGDMLRVRSAIDGQSKSYPGSTKRYRPDCAHLHIYVVEDGHPALT